MDLDEEDDFIGENSFAFCELRHRFISDGSEGN